ncbi:hypothetical protein NBRC116602_06290 [Hyphomicrobiales bacterium 4NK60-0047b]|jgi:hypothetical protein
MSRLFSILFLTFFSFLVVTTSASAKRIALVIGNDDYRNVTKLYKAVNDAVAVTRTIRQIGFEVIESLNANRRSFDQKLNYLSSKIEAGDEVLFFFAGHGISFKGRNYLLPIDVPRIAPGEERSIIKEAFSEDEIISVLRERGAKVSILIIDACRNNPFPKKGTRSVGRSVGLGQRSNPPRNTFVLYSAGIGEEALDRLSDEDLNPNSIFTRKLIPLLKKPGLSHLQLAKKIQIEVEKLALSTPSRHQQFPAFYDQMRGEYFLVSSNRKLSKNLVKDRSKTNSTADGSDYEKDRKSEMNALQNKISELEKAIHERNNQAKKESETALLQVPDVKLKTINRCGWFAISYCTESIEVAGAKAREFGGFVIFTSEPFFPNFTNGWFCSVEGPFSRNGAIGMMKLFKRRGAFDAYIKKSC